MKPLHQTLIEELQGEGRERAGAWEIIFSTNSTDEERKLAYEDIDHFISHSVTKTYNKAYAEGAKDAEGTKNGVKRYQLGYADGSRETLERAKEAYEQDKHLTRERALGEFNILHEGEVEKARQETLERVREGLLNTPTEKGGPECWDNLHIPIESALALTTNKEEETKGIAEELGNSDKAKAIRQIRNMQIDSQRMTLNKPFDSKEEEATKEEVKHHCLDLNDCICE